MERWIDIKGYEGLYQISDFGRVKSLPKIVERKNKTGNYLHKEKILKPIIHKQGYMRISLKHKQTRKMFLIHRLVAEHFITNPENKKEVNHINLNKADNRASSLEWVTPKENTQHYFTALALKNGRI